MFPDYPKYKYDLMSLGSKTRGFWPFKKELYKILTIGIEKEGLVEVKIIKKYDHWTSIEIRPTRISAFSCSKEGLMWLQRNIRKILKDLGRCSVCGEFNDCDAGLHG